MNAPGLAQSLPRQGPRVRGRRELWLLPLARALQLGLGLGLVLVLMTALEPARA